MKRFLSLVLPVALLFGCATHDSKGNAGDSGLTAAKTDVAALKTGLRQKTPDQLIGMFVPDGPKKHGGYEYYYNYMVNMAIREELKSRGVAAHSALQKHLDDTTRIWEAINGPGDTVGRICAELLKE